MSEDMGYSNQFTVDARRGIGGERFVSMENRYADEDVQFSVGAENDNGAGK